MASCPKCGSERSPALTEFVPRVVPPEFTPEFVEAARVTHFATVACPDCQTSFRAVAFPRHLAPRRFG